MAEPGYPAARTVAATVETFFARHHAAASGTQELGPPPEAPIVETMINSAFWASLRREEGRSPRISLAYLPPGQAERPLVFERRLALSANTLTHLAPAVERPGIHLGVWRDADGLYVWGATRIVPILSFVLEVVEPGLIVVKYSRGESLGKYGNIVVLRGEEIKVVDENIASDPDCPGLLSSLVGLNPPVTWHDSSSVLVQLAVSMRAHARGGTLLVVPADSRRWQESIVRPFSYRIEPVFTRLSETALNHPGDNSDQERRQAMQAAIEGVAGLTAVDGATVMNDRYELLAFGAKIRLTNESTPVEQVLAKEPVLGDAATLAEMARIGGTRHLSAAQFVHDQRDALALVASQDGQFTIFTWSAHDDLIHANRVETLLL